MSIPITFACGRYDRTAALREGTIRPDGVELTYLCLSPEEIFFRMARFAEFDASEFSLGSYLASLRGQPARFVALPVFPSRAFRHSGIYVNSEAGITTPEGLVGRRVGLAEWQLTANVWIRGILAEHYGVAVDAVEYLTGGLNAPGRAEKLPVALPPGIHLRAIPPGESLSALLVRGEIDALYSPRAPRHFVDGDPRISRLFGDSAGEEKRYFEETGVFPIMHVVVLRAEIYREHRWIARSLYNALCAAKRRAEQELDETAALCCMLPWLHEELRRTRDLLGPDYWPYGLTSNRRALQKFVSYAVDQGVAEPAPLEHLFAPETLEDVVV